MLLGGYSLRLFRIFVAEADRFPELGAMFYRNGPLVMQENLRDYLELAVSRGELRIADVDLAAAQFLEMCKADVFLRFLFKIDESFTEAELARVIDGAIETFMPPRHSSQFATYRFSKGFQTWRKSLEFTDNAG